MRILKSCVAGLPIWIFWSQILKFCFFLEIKKARKIWLFLAYFQSDRLSSDKTLSELHIHYKFLVTRVCYHAGCTKYCKNFTVALKMIDVIDKKQMHDSVITGANMLLKIGLVLYRWFWRVLMSILCVVVHVLCVYASKVLPGFFWWRQVGNPVV